MFATIIFFPSQSKRRVSTPERKAPLASLFRAFLDPRPSHLHSLPAICASVDLILKIYLPGKSLKFEQVAIPAGPANPSTNAHRLAPEPHPVRYDVQYSCCQMRSLSARFYLAMLFRDPVGVVDRWLHLRLVGHRECDLQNLD